ncbi:MAG TPA: 16S rRNA (adenine(1518)-N(6)/adenine(1519)-N(6))-dimethyltransferase RsmA, partial [Candidatus Gracilibacteria bacterium]|nr:16S rRNA (adenine(1518)-N(6)/adenine(1519)-N(6))-dimethyltransferase RsmA [Candidatus Gracilibacteria bacterium]
MSYYSESADLQAFLKSYRFRFKPQWGQNFLLDTKILQQIADVADLTAQDTVIEIGPGPGLLTKYLLKTDLQKLICLEIDEDLKPILQNQFRDDKRFSLQVKDARDFTIDSDTSAYAVVANIPYYLTSPLLRHFLTMQPFPRTIVVLVQKEVAEKICEDSEHQSVLSLLVARHGKAEIIAKVPKEAFLPAPKVDSAILKISLYDQPLIDRKDWPLFEAIIKIAFQQARKKLANTLANYVFSPKLKGKELLEKAGIDLNRRPQTLTLAE